MGMTAADYTSPTIFWRGESAYVNWRVGGERKKRALGKVSEREAKELCVKFEAELAKEARARAAEREFG